jgi:outer membrane protein assembly factor BamD (BamD/ComL family)
MFSLMVTILMMAALWGGSGWEYLPGQGFVNSQTGDIKTPQAFLAYGEKLHADGKFDEAADAMGVLADAAIDTPLRESGLLVRARSLSAGGRHAEAHFEYDRFVRIFPESSRGPAAREELMRTDLAWVREGDLQSVLGIPLYRSSRAAIRQLKETLLRFSREEATDDYYLRLAAYYLEQEDRNAAEDELTFILENYPMSDSAPRALLLRAKIRLNRFDAIDYDLKPLIDAKRDYEKFAGDYLRHAEDAGRLRQLGLDPARLHAMEGQVREGLRFVNAKQAEKELALARFYIHRDRPRSAKVYLDSILRNYAGTPSAVEAQQLLGSLGK